MKNLHLNEDNEPFLKRLWRSLSMVFVMLPVFGILAFPLPGIIDYLNLNDKIEEYQEKKRRLPVLEAQVGHLQRLATRHSDLEDRLNKAFPEVKSVLILRNLVLAQAQTAGVALDLLESSPPAYIDLFGKTIGSLDMTLKGSGDTRDLILFIGLLEATGLAYRIDSMKASFSLENDGRVSFSLNFKVSFQGDRSMLDHDFRDESIKHREPEGDDDAHQP